MADGRLQLKYDLRIAEKHYDCRLQVIGNVRYDRRPQVIGNVRLDGALVHPDSGQVRILNGSNNVSSYPTPKEE